MAASPGVILAEPAGSGGGSGLSGGAIAGIVIGTLAGVSILGAREQLQHTLSEWPHPFFSHKKCPSARCTAHICSAVSANRFYRDCAQSGSSRCHKDSMS